MNVASVPDAADMVTANAISHAFERINLQLLAAQAEALRLLREEGDGRQAFQMLAQIAEVGARFALSPPTAVTRAGSRAASTTREATAVDEIAATHRDRFPLSAQILLRACRNAFGSSPAYFELHELVSRLIVKAIEDAGASHAA